MDRTKKVIIGIIIGWAVCILGIVGFLIIKKQMYKANEREREDIISNMVSDIELDQHPSFVVSADDLEVVGEEDLYADPEPIVTSAPSSLPSESESSGPSESDEGSDSNSSGDYNLITYGTISIPSIDLKLPIWEGAGKVELRYGVGHIPVSADAGQTGNFCLMGHRMKKYGSIFNRLGEVQIGDTIEVSAGDSIYHYKVDQIETISPSELSSYIGVSEEDCRITLITCTPTGVGSHRLLVIGHLE